jgi:predicted RNase H-like HicB family nuclease
LPHFIEDMSISLNSSSVISSSFFVIALGYGNFQKFAICARMEYDISMIKNQFKVIIERDEDGYFVASVPALPGCYTQSKTIDELRKNVRDAIRLCLEVARQDQNYRKRIKQLAYEPSFIGMEVISL